MLMPLFSATTSFKFFSVNNSLFVVSVKVTV